MQGGSYRPIDFSILGRRSIKTRVSTAWGAILHDGTHHTSRAWEGAERSGQQAAHSCQAASLANCLPEKHCLSNTCMGLNAPYI
jgi:hypothetical protein